MAPTKMEDNVGTLLRRQLIPPLFITEESS